MSCPCEDNKLVYYNECAQTEDPDVSGCLTTPKTSCITYDGDGLGCLSVVTGAEFNDVLDKICVALGSVSNTPTWDMSTNTYCVTDITSGSITTWKEFAEGMSKAFCDYKTSNNTALGVTNTNVTNLTTTVAGVTNFSITGCSYLGITGATTLSALRQAFATKICDLDSRLSLSGVTWDACLTTSTPTTLAGALSTIEAQICAVKAIAEAAPGADLNKVMFDNVDTDPNYLYEKMTNTSCIAKATITDGGGVKRVGFNLTFTPKMYTFDPTFFDVTTLSTGACYTTYGISIKAGVIPDPVDPYVISCGDVESVFTASSVGVLPTKLMAEVSTSCQYVEECGVRNWLFSGYTSGDYVMRINTAAGACSKVTLVTSPVRVDNICAAAGWHSLSSSLQAGATIGGVITWTATAGGAITVPISSVPRPPQYRWTRDGNIEFRGAISFSMTTLGSNVEIDFPVAIGSVDMSCVSTTLFPQEAIVMDRTIDDGSDGMQAHVLGVLYLDSVTGTLGMRVYINTNISFVDQDAVATLDSVSFKF